LKTLGKGLSGRSAVQPPQTDGSRSKDKMKNQSQTKEKLFVLPIYQKNQWEALRASATGEMKETWEEWNSEGEKYMAELTARGIAYVRIPLDVEELKQFCEEQGIPNDGAARTELLRQRYKTERV
jgi:hypothetical protein